MNKSDQEFLKISIEYFQKNFHRKNNAEVKFPSPLKLSTDPKSHFPLIVEQAIKLIDGDQSTQLCGLFGWDEDRAVLIEKIVHDIKQFVTENNIQIPKLNTFLLAQNIITEQTAFNIARSNLLPEKYKSVELSYQTEVYKNYAIPFLLRLAIESKLKSMVGFVKSDVKRKYIQKGTQEFPVAAIIQELKKIDCLKIPCSLDDMGVIYKWACKFPHSGRKEYIWLCMKATELVASLFSHDENKKYVIEIGSLWSAEERSSEGYLNRLIAHPGPKNPLYYFKNGWNIAKLQEKLNSLENTSLAPYTFYLSENALGENDGFYCKMSNIYI